MSGRLLFLTGRLAERSLRRVLEAMQPDFAWEVRQIGLQVAGLMTAELVRRRLAELEGVARVILPGRCRGDIDALAAHFGLPFERGPDELKDLPAHFGRKSATADLSRHALTIFAEIVDAPHLSVDAVLARARRYAADGADVIDLGCLPGTAFPHLEDCVRALCDAGLRVSVDSLESDELLRGGRAGADYLLSLREDTLWIADEVAATPVLIPRTHGDLDSLERAIDALRRRGRAFIADPILDPIHFGFTEAVVRYRELRRRRPDVPMMMGSGNVTELTDADTAGITTLLLGICSELEITHLLATEVSPHARRAVREADRARRMLFAARRDDALPRGYTDALMALHERKPFPDSAAEIAELAAVVKDPSFRVQVSEAGIHVYNRDGMRLAQDPFALWPRLGVDDDAGHAFYLGVELARAQIAWQLGKRYVQDRELGWGCAWQPAVEEGEGYCAPGTTLPAGRKPEK